MTFFTHLPGTIMPKAHPKSEFEKHSHEGLIATHGTIVIVAADRTGILPRPVRSKSRLNFRQRKCIQLSSLQQLLRQWLVSTPRHPHPVTGYYILPYSSSNPQGNGFLQCELLEKIGIVGAGVAKEFWGLLDVNAQQDHQLSCLVPGLAQDLQRRNTSQCPAA